jgi:hypothetical protein
VAVQICEMGGFGSGRYGGRPTVESAVRLDIDALRRDGMIRFGVRAGCVIRFSGPYDDLEVECETHIGGPWDDWVRLKYDIGQANRSRLTTRFSSHVTTTSR